MILVVTSKDGILFPADECQHELARTLPQNKMIKVKAEISRNIGNHRRFFAFLKVVYNLQEFYPTQEALRMAMIVEAGYFNYFEMHDKRTIIKPHSLKFDEMKELEFKKVFSDCIDASYRILTATGANVTDEQLNALARFV